MATQEEITKAFSDFKFLNRIITLGVELGASENDIRTAFSEIVTNSIEIDVGGVGVTESSLLSVYNNILTVNVEAIEGAFEPSVGKNTIYGITDDMIIAAIQTSSIMQES